MVSDVVTDVANRMSLPLEHIETIALAHEDRYGEAISELFENGTFTDNESYVGVAKTKTVFLNETPKHTILFKDFVFELILRGLSVSQTVNDWSPELQKGLYIVSHELGHCKDAEKRMQSSEETILSLPNGFDLTRIHEYYYPIFIDEFYACFNADGFYSLEHLKCQASQDSDSISKLQSKTLRYRLDRDLDDRIYQVAVYSSQLVWTYLIQYAKIWVGKNGTDFESVLIPSIIDFEFTNTKIVKILDRYFESLVTGYSSNNENIFEHFEPIWNAISLHIGYKFEYDETNGWACYWN